MAITGEVGTGKTTLCRTLLRRLGSDTEVAFLFNPTLTPLELLKAINGEFGLSTFGESRPELTDVLNAFLVESRAEGRRVLLIIDEAQNLATETLEQLRLLSNLETETSKMLQIVLLGQPELDQKLAAQNLRQLRQRISVWSHLGPMNAEETGEYVRHRLRVAGQERPIFTDRRAAHGPPSERRRPAADQPDLRPRAARGLRGPAGADRSPARDRARRKSCAPRDRRGSRWERAALALGAAGVLLAVGLFAVVGMGAFPGEPEPAPAPVSARPAPAAAVAAPRASSGPARARRRPRRAAAAHQPRRGARRRARCRARDLGKARVGRAGARVRRAARAPRERAPRADADPARAPGAAQRGRPRARLAARRVGHRPPRAAARGCPAIMRTSTASCPA